ncbi:MAG: MotA/TolQ/ExbB proton channel family protein [Bryobacteraceae bacterium]
MMQDAQNSRLALTQAASAVALSAVSFVILILLQQHFGEGLRYQERFFGHWTRFVCILLAFWSLSILFTKWRDLVRRARSKDNLVAARVEKLIEQFQASQDSAAVAAALNTQSETAQADLESGYAPVRVFAWTIPVLGFIGTVLGAGQAVGGFANFLLTSAQQPDEVRRAVAAATSNLAFALETTLIAVLLTVIVAVFYFLLLQREKAFLRSIDELCRSRLMLLVRREPSPETGKMPELDTAYFEQSKEITQEFVRSLTETEALLAGQREVLDKVLEAMRESQERSIAPDPGRPETNGKSNPMTADAYPSWEQRAPSSAMDAARSMPADMDDIWAPLEDLRETIREVNPILRRLAEHLRQTADEAKQPPALKLNFAARPSSVKVGE